MSKLEKYDMVLDAYNLGAINKAELRWMMEEIRLMGDRLTRERIVQLIAGNEDEEEE